MDENDRPQGGHRLRAWRSVGGNGGHRITDKDDGSRRASAASLFEGLRSCSRKGHVLVAVCSVLSLLVFCVVPVAAKAPVGTRIVPQGVGRAALQGLKVFGKTPASTPETVSFVLKARNLGALEHQVALGMPQGTLSVARFARLYGQPESKIQALESYLGQFGISTTAYANGLDVTATGTAGEFDSALSVTQQEYQVPAAPPSNGHAGRPAMTVHGTTDSVLLPADIAPYVLSVLGLNNYPTFASMSVHVPALAAGNKPSAVETGSRTPADFAQQYGVDPLYKAGMDGAGQAIGIVTLATLDPADPYDFWKNVLHIHVLRNRISLVNVDGGAGPVSAALGSGESALDVEQSGALAPQAKIVVYQAPNTDYGFLDAFFTAATQNVAGSVSASWGESETAIAASAAAGFESPSYVQAYDEAFLELAAQGQSTFNSAGDFGAYTAAQDIGTTNLSVSNPADSPYLTAAGGTTLAGTIPLTATTSATVYAQRTWGWDWLWPHYALYGFPSEGAMASAYPVGGGGGFSASEPTPIYQQGIAGLHQYSAVEYLTPTDYQDVSGLTLPTAWLFNPKPSVRTGMGSGRAVPDLSADADPFTGYLLDFQGSVQAGWGGTSFVAPQFAGVTALMNQYVGHRVGFWNPAIYRFAQGPNSPFTPLDATGTTNDNLYYTGTQGHIYNVGSGLGTPNFMQLAQDFLNMDTPRP